MSPSYQQFMEEERPYITVRLDLKDPVEMGDFVDFFASIGRQFEKYIRSEYAISGSEPTVFIREVRKGSIVAEIIAIGGMLIDHMDSVLIVTGFASLFSSRIRSYIKGTWDSTANKSDLKDFFNTVKAVKKDLEGRATIESAYFKEGIFSKEVALTFNREEAEQAVKAIENHKRELDKTSGADYSRVLMYFQRSDKGSVEIGRRSGERVVIEAISQKDRPLIYASALAEEKIKDEIRNSDENIYKKGFVVDVNALTKDARFVAYAVTAVHQIIDLPDD